MQIKKNDKVIVIAGKDKGKKGEVIEFLPKKGKIRVKGVAIATRHVKPKRQGETGGIIKSEALIDRSNVMLMCSACSSATKLGAKLLSDGKKVRMCRRCKEVV